MMRFRPRFDRHAPDETHDPPSAPGSRKDLLGGSLSGVPRRPAAVTAIRGSVTPSDPRAFTDYAPALPATSGPYRRAGLPDPADGPVGGHGRPGSR
jgi:hypothetical protein